MMQSNYYGGDDTDHSRELRMTEAQNEVQVKKIQKGQRIIESYF